MTFSYRFQKTYLLPLAAALLLVPIVAAQGFLDQLLSPFGGLDVPGAYARYWGIIDFLIYALLFTGIAHVTVGKRFEGRGGRAITAAVALIFTVSLLLVERQMGFNIGSFGPLAGAIVVVMVGMTLYTGIRQLGGGHMASGSIAFIATYFSVRAVTPQLFEWLATAAPFVHAALVVALLVAIWRLVGAFWPSPAKVVKETAAKGIEEAKEAVREVFPTPKMEEEQEMIKARLKPFTRRQKREHQAILADLKEMQAIVAEHRDSPYAVALIAKKLRNLRPKEHYIEARLAAVQALTKQLLKLDECVIARIKGEDPSKLTREKRRVIKKIWKDEKAKIKAETRLRAFEALATKFLAAFDRALDLAVASLKAGRPEECQKQLAEAIKTEIAAGRLLKRMERLEDELRMWTQVEEKVATPA